MIGMEVIQGEKLQELEYGVFEHNNDKAKVVTFVGKGIMYNTGGLFLKISQ